jgi:hypothetical protein
MMGEGLIAYGVGLALHLDERFYQLLVAERGRVLGSCQGNRRTTVMRARASLPGRPEALEEIRLTIDSQCSARSRLARMA